VLIIEDDRDVARAFARTLQHANLESFIAADADAAFNAIDERMPDMILLDAQLPAIGGLEICRILRAKDATRHVSILIVTGADTDEHRLESLKAGADGFLAKPFEPHALIERIENLLELRHHAAELRAMTVDPPPSA
jgi:DNA-binding response OmpR family regulator